MLQFAFAEQFKKKNFVKNFKDIFFCFKNIEITY